MNKLFNHLSNLRQKHIFSKKEIYLNKLKTHTETEDFIFFAFGYAYSNNVEGDYLEFGVFEGHSAICAYRSNRFYSSDHMKKYLWLYDSFEGLPNIQEKDSQGFQKYKSKDCYCNYDNFLKILKRNKIDKKEFNINKNWYSNLKEIDIPLKSAIIFIDCDLYESAKQALNLITKSIQDGTLLAFHDFYMYKGNPNYGERRAFLEWVKENNIEYTLYKQFDVVGQSFIIHKVKK